LSFFDEANLNYNSIQNSELRIVADFVGMGFSSFGAFRIKSCVSLATRHL